MRGESERVAERVRSLLDEHGRAPGDEVVPAAVEPRHSRPGTWARLRARVPVRVDPGRRSAIAVGVAVALAAVLTGVWVLAARPRAVPVSSAPGTASAAPIGTGAGSPGRPHSPAPPRSSAVRPPVPASSGGAVVVVDVAGKVRHPGLYRLPAGARVDDAVRAAGGALPRVRLDTLNLAAKLIDGQQIAVGIAPAAGGGPVAGGSAAGGPAGGAASGPVNLNTAGLVELQSLPGVGPVLAQHILDWRSAHGGFASVDQLNDVPGIGEVKFASLKSLVSV